MSATVRLGGPQGPALYLVPHPAGSTAAGDRTTEGTGVRTVVGNVVEGAGGGGSATGGAGGPAACTPVTWPGLEIAVVVAAVTIVSTLLGLVLSGLVRDENQAMPLLVMLSMAQLVVSGGVVPVVDTEVLPPRRIGMVG